MIEGQLERTRVQRRREELERELEVPPFPVELQYIWDAFWRLRRRKGGSGFALSPIEWTDIEAFCRFAGKSLSSWDVSLIEMLDDLYLDSQAQRTETDKAQ